MILAPSLSITQPPDPPLLFLLNETPSHESGAELGSGYRLLPLHFVLLFVTQLNPFREVSKPHLPESPANFL